MQLVVTNTYEIPDAELQQLAADLIVTAVEGGIDYWAEVRSYGHDGAPFAYAAEIVEEDEPDTVHTITTDKVVELLGKIARGEVETYKGGYDGTLGERLRAAFRQCAEQGCDLSYTDLDFDAWDADFVVQTIALGGVVYG